MHHDVPVWNSKCQLNNLAFNVNILHPHYLIYCICTTHWDALWIEKFYIIRYIVFAQTDAIYIILYMNWKTKHHRIYCICLTDLDVIMKWKTEHPLKNCICLTYWDAIWIEKPNIIWYVVFDSHLEYDSGKKYNKPQIQQTTMLF